MPSIAGSITTTTRHTAIANDSNNKENAVPNPASPNFAAKTFSPKACVFYLDLLDNPLLPKIIRYILHHGGVHASLTSNQFRSNVRLFSTAPSLT